MDPFYLTQMVFACLLALCSCLGNTTALISMKLTPVPAPCPYFINLMFLELMAVMFGPVAYLVTVFVDPGWLKEGTSTCTGAIILQKFSLIGSLLALTFLAWSHCHKRELPQKKIVVVFSILSTWFLPAILLLCEFITQKSHFLDIPWFMCSTTNTLQGYSLIGIVIVAIAICIHSFSLWLSISSIMSKNIYHMQDQWKRHKRENTVNDPECSTFHMSHSESTSVSLDKIFGVTTIPGKRSSVGQISFFNANRNWALSQQPEIPKTEKVPKTNSDSNEVFYENDRIETSKASCEDGVEYKRRSTALDSVFIDLPEACVAAKQSFDCSSSLGSIKHSPTTEIPFSNVRVKNPAMSSQRTSPSQYMIASLSPSRQTPPSTAIRHPSYSPVLTTSPWYYTTSQSCSAYPETPGFGDIRKYKRAKYISPTTLDFANADRTISEFKKLVLLVACLSMTSWLLFSVILILWASGLDLPVEVLRLSTMVLFFKSAMTPVLYGLCFSRYRLACKKHIKSKLPQKPDPERKCSFKLNDATVIGAYLAQDDCGVQLEKYSVLSYDRN